MDPTAAGALSPEIVALGLHRETGRHRDEAMRALANVEQRLGELRQQLQAETRQSVQIAAQTSRQLATHAVELHGQVCALAAALAVASFAVPTVAPTTDDTSLAAPADGGH